MLLHELGHGLGFQVLTNSSNGRRLGNPPLPSMWERLMLDNDTGKTWFDMSNFERRRSAVNFRSLVWTGASVTANASTVLSLGSPQLTKGGLRPKTYEVATGTFSAPLTPAGVTAKAATIVTQPGEVGPGCSPYDAGNAAAVAGKIAVVDRGACALTQKVKNAQDAGAVGVIIAQVVAGSPTTAGGSDPAIVIPAVVVSQDDGADIMATIRPGFQPTLTMRLNTSQLAGADTSGRVFLYTPDPLSGGSSVSHWDTLATRNLLMEPFINDDLSHEVKAPHDLTLQLFIDLGW